MNPLDQPDSHDVVKIAGFQTNVDEFGISEIDTAAFVIRWQHQTGVGIVGAVSRPLGTDPIRFVWRQLFYTGDQIENFSEKILPLLVPPKSTSTASAAKMLSWFHPLTSRPPIVVSSVGVEEVSALKRIEDSGLWAIETKLFGYKKVKILPAKPLVEPADEKPRPQDLADLTILNLSSQVATLAKR